MSERAPLILIVEDDVELARLNARFLKYRGYDAVVANTVKEARAAFKKAAPDLFLLDVELPDGDGFSLCEELRQDTDAPILFLTGRTETKDKVKGLNTSGDYYLTKPFDSDVLLAVIRNLLRKSEQTRKKIDEATVLTKGSVTLRIDERKAFVEDRDAGLTPKEFAVLLILMQNEDVEVSCERIYESVWGTKMYGDPQPVRLHMSRLKKKLGEEDASDFNIFTEYGRGYTFSTL